MDIVDAQVHLGLEGADANLAQMNALGIQAVLIDELWPTPNIGLGDEARFNPGYALANGAWRCVSPVGEQASLRYPDRFSCVQRVDRRDPQLENLLKLLQSAPHVRAIRVLPTWTETEADAFEAGEYNALFELAQALGLPVFCFVPGRVDLLVPYLQRFPRLRFIVDHCGMPFGTADPGYFDQVLALASSPNAALKWGHAQAGFGVSEYPYLGLRPFLRRAINAFGAERIAWASDKTVIRDQTWADLLFCIRDNPELNSTEKEWILGRSLRALLDWPLIATP